MDLTQLEYFREAARTGNFTQAAQHLHITQPALSKTISNLENDLAVKLFDRKGKRIALNDYGQIVQRYADRIFHDLDQMQRELTDLNTGIAGTLHLAVSVPTREPDVILQELTKFIEEYPQVCVTYNYSSSKMIQDSLLDGSLDLAVTSSIVQTKEILWTKLYEERMGIILSRNHPLAQKSEVCMADLKDHWFFCNNAGNDTRDLTYIFCEKANFVPKVRFEGFAPLQIGQWISNGDGISFIAEEKFRQQYVRDMEMGVRPWSENITFRRVTDPYCKRDCGLAYVKDRYLPRAVQEVYDRLVKRFHQTP